MVFKAAMSSNYSKINDLQIMRENITRIDGNNLTIKQMHNLRILDLSFNLIRKIEHLDFLQNLRDLNISYNHIKVMENLKFPSLHTLNLSHNKITQIKNIR
jgi:protein phosphatase 1 regulatory subunit 7